MSRDMTIFVDDNGKAYHIYSSEGNITLHIAELTPDYTGHNGKYVRVFVNRYMEAPAICKHNGKYYMIASGCCSGWAPNARPAAPWPPHGRTVDGAQKSLRGAQGQYAPSADKAPTSCPYRASPARRLIFIADIWRPKNADGRHMLGFP